MKKIVIFIIAVIVLIVVVLKPNESEEIRVRIVPNSNNEIDLVIKEEVKERVIVFLEENYDKDRNLFIDNMQDKIPFLKQELEEKSIRTNISLCEHNFYNKTYNNNSVKNAKVLTLLVVIEEGNGDNWWGSIYPNLLEVNSSEVVRYKSFLKKIYDKYIGD